MYEGHSIITYIYRAPFHTICHSALQLLTTFTPNTAHTSATDAKSLAYIACSSHTRTHTHTLSKQCHVSFECWSEGLTEKSWLRKADVFWKCFPESWSKIRVFTTQLSVDRWNAQHKAVCIISKLPRRCVDLEHIRMVDRASRCNGTETNRRNCVFDSSVDWKPVQSVKMKCSVVSPGSFQDETVYIISNLLKSV